MRGVIQKTGGWYYFVRRIPRDMQRFVLGKSGKPMQQISIALKTQDHATAVIKAREIWDQKKREWAALSLGDQTSAYHHYKQALDIATSRGLEYRPVTDMMKNDVDELVRRLNSLVPSNDAALPPPEVVDAVMGITPIALPDLRVVLSEYFDLTLDRHVGKTAKQLHKAKLPKTRAVEHFYTALPELEGWSVDKIDRTHVLKFRTWWWERVQSGLSAETANKDFGHLSDIVSTWFELTGNKGENPFSGIRFKARAVKATSKTRPPFTRDFVRDVILRVGALDKLNEEARDALLIMINTGARPSEIIDADMADYRLTENIPYLSICENGRILKQVHTARDIPLIGVSLDAARRVVARGGFARYRGNVDTWSALVNAYMRNNGLMQSDVS